MAAPLHVIFDTNVLFSAIGWRGVPWQCVELARAGRVRAFTCEALTSELEEKLTTKLALTSAELAAVMEDLLSFLHLLPNPTVLPGVCRDADDDWVLALATTAPADRIVSGDRDLLILGAFVGIPILSPRDFLTQFERLPAA